MKKKPIFNNEVDIDLLFNQPNALRKYIGLLATNPPNFRQSVC